MLSQIGDPVNWRRTIQHHLRWMRSRGWRQHILVFGLDIYPIGWPILEQSGYHSKIANDNSQRR